MSDTNKSQFKKTLILILLLLLFLLVSMQAWYMFEMKKQMDDLYQQQAFAQGTTQGAIQVSTQEATVTIAGNEKAAKVKTEKEESAESESALNATAEQPGETQQALQDKLPVQPESSIPESPLQESSVQEPPMQSAQPEDESISPENTSPFGMDDTTTMPSDLQAWNPYAEIQRMQREMDRRLNQRFNRQNNYPGHNYSGPGYLGLNHPGRNNPDFQYHFSQRMSMPEIHVKENANQYVVFVDLPGANENDISVTLNNQRLSIKGKQDYKKQNKDATGNVIFQEQRSGRFQRSITLSEPVSEKGMKTQLENGVLKITIAKVKDARWR